MTPRKNRKDQTSPRKRNPEKQPPPLPARQEVPAEHRWNLASLYPSEEAWEEDLKEWEKQIGEIPRFKGTLGESAARLAEALDFMTNLEEKGERLGTYAHLRTAEDVGDSSASARFSRYMALAARADAAASYQTPEIQAVPEETMETFLADPVLEDHRIPLRKILRYRPYILSEKEERLLAMQEEMNQTMENSFSALTNADMDFGDIDGSPLTNSTFAVFQMDPDRSVRERSYRQFYRAFENHRHTLTEIYKGSVQKDLYQTRVRGFSSCRARSLFRDDVPEGVYDNLISTVRENLPLVHRYYRLRCRLLGIEELRQYDRIVPLVPAASVQIPYEEAVETVLRAAAPLGSEYTETLREGLLGGWVDRYENRGKRSGAFSSGAYSSAPYILLNYQDTNLRDLFTLAHEAGHSMHSWYSARNNPFPTYQYTIFEAEVASTFNEQLLARQLKQEADSEQLRLSVTSRQMDDFLGTMVRQTMFAEFEHLVHRQAEEGTPLTEESLRKIYRQLLTSYFGPQAVLEPASDLEGLRIPHFYRAFYVYKYATGIAASLALSQRVLQGGDSEKRDYQTFLKSGGSRFPLESLRAAGVDMARPEPIRQAFRHFEGLLEEMESAFPEGSQSGG